MVRCFAPPLTLAVMLWGLVPAALATGPLGPEIRFFTRSGQDPVDDLAYFRGHLGILRPTFTDNRLYAAYRMMLGGRFSEAQDRQLLARCSLPSCRPHFHSSCATSCCWSGPARAARISAHGFTTSTF